MVNTLEFDFGGWISFTRRAGGLILFFLFFGVLYLLVGGGVGVTWSRDSSLGPAEIASFVHLVLFKDEGRRVSPRFHLFVSDVNH